MSQSQLFSLQGERIDAIIRNDVSRVTAIAHSDVQQIETYQYFVRLSIPSAPQYNRDSASNWNVVTTWRIRFFHSAIDTADYAAQMNLYSFADDFANAFLSRRRLQLNDSDLAYCKESVFSFASGFDSTLNFLDKQYRGFDMNLRITSANITRQAS